MGVEYGWSVVHSGRHDPSEMERLLEKIKLEVRTAWAKESVAKGVSYNDAKRYGDAIKCFDEALKLDSKLVEGTYVGVRRWQTRGNTRTRSLTGRVR